LAGSGESVIQKRHYDFMAVFWLVWLCMKESGTQKSDYVIMTVLW